MKNIFLYIILIFAFSSYAEDALNRAATFNKRREGKKHGMWEKKYFLSKKLKSTCEFENGKRSGKYYKYYKSGFLKISRQYTNNRKSGKECFYRDKVKFESIKRCIQYEKRKKKKVAIDFYEGLDK